MKIPVFKSSILLFALVFSFIVKGQYRNYTLVYTSDTYGSIVMFGNTLMNIVDSNEVNVGKMNNNSLNGVSIYGNDMANMQFADVDGNLGSGSRTRNSSTADLLLPGGVNTIKLARLYWGGRVNTADYDLTKPVNQKIALRKGTSAFYTEFTAVQIDTNVFVQDSIEYARYQACTDITSFIQSNGAGTYSAGNAPLSTGPIANGGNYGGWCIVVVFENSLLNFNSLRLYDGFQQVFDSGNLLTTSITLTGLNVPPGTLETEDAKMGVAAWEGDANLAGDFLKINGNLFSNGINQPNNPWNGTITDNGLHITTKNPNYTNQMGVDIDQFYAGSGYGIMPYANTALLEFGTEADQYFPGIISFVVKSVPTPLPVGLLYLNSRLENNNSVKISWGTSLEINCDHYIIERSLDGNSFSPIASVPGNGTTSSQHDYLITDDVSTITALLLYYRVKQIDLDDKKHYSEIISLRRPLKISSMVAWPNPFRSYFNINLHWSKSERAVLNILDANGQKLFAKSISLSNGHNVLKVDDLPLLLPGTYLIQLVSETKKFTYKMVKE